MHAIFNLFPSFGGLFDSKIGPIADFVGLAFAFVLVPLSVKAVKAKIGSEK